MASSPLLLVLTLGAVDPCAAVPTRAEGLTRAARDSAERFGTELAHLEAELGATLILPPESQRAPSGLAALAGSRLEAICALRSHPAPRTSAPDRARLSAILDRPEFSEARSRGGDAIVQWLRCLRQWLDELFETRGAQSYSELTRVVVLALAVAGVVGGLLRLRARRPEQRDTRPEARGPEALVLDSPEEHLARARAALVGDAREAIRQGLLGLLSALERRRLARPDRVKTNRELASELPSRGAPPELTAQVTELLRWYDRTFYSLEPVPPAEAQRFVETVGRLDGALRGAS